MFSAFAQISAKYVTTSTRNQLRVIVDAEATGNLGKKSVFLWPDLS